MTMIASIGPNLPIDLLTASGRFTGPVAFAPDRSAPTASKWLESKFAPWAFCVLENWAEGLYDGLESIVFSRADDTSHRLYYYVCELQSRGLIGGPAPIIFDIAKIDRPSSIDRIASQVRLLADRLGVTEVMLAAAIREMNAVRREASGTASSDARPCLLVGTAPPDLRLHSVVERSGFTPFGDTIVDDWSAQGALVDESQDPFRALAEQVHANPHGPRSMADPGKILRQRIETIKPEAIILWRIEEDEAQAWHLPAQITALQESGLPHLVMTRRDWLCRDGAPAEITTFLNGIAR